MRSNSWEKALRRLAAYYKCYLYVNVNTEQMIECRPNVTIPGQAETSSYSVALGYIVADNTAYPMMKPMLSKWKKKKTKNQYDGQMQLLSVNDPRPRDSDTAVGVKTVEAACKRYLYEVKGYQLGILEYKKISDRSGYMEEIFTPVAIIPDFNSLAELNLKLEAIGA